MYYIGSFFEYFTDEFHDNLAGLSEVEGDQVLSVMKAAEEEHFEVTYSVPSQPAFLNGDVFS